jgi:hypothetical protein
MVFSEYLDLMKIVHSVGNHRTDVFDLLQLLYEITFAEQELHSMDQNFPYDVQPDNGREHVSYVGRELAKRAKEIRDRTGVKPFLIAHSRGGLVARHCLQLTERDDYLSGAILLASPNHGTAPEEFSPLEKYMQNLTGRFHIEDMSPGSAYLEELDAAEPPKVPVYNVYSRDGDWLVPEGAHLPWAENIELPWKGHMEYLFDQGVHGLISDICPDDTHVIYLHGQNNIASIICEGLFPGSTMYPGPLWWLPSLEREFANASLLPIHTTLARTGKLQSYSNAA